MSEYQTESTLDEFAASLVPYWKQKYLIVAFALAGLIAAGAWLAFVEIDEKVEIKLRSIDENQAQAPQHMVQFESIFTSEKNFELWKKSNESSAKYLEYSKISGLTGEPGFQRLLSEEKKGILIIKSRDDGRSILIKDATDQQIMALASYAEFTSLQLTNKHVAQIDFLIEKIQSFLQTGEQIDKIEFDQLISLEGRKRSIEISNGIVEVLPPSLPFSNKTHSGVVLVIGTFVGGVLGAVWIFISLVLVRIRAFS